MDVLYYISGINFKQIENFRTEKMIQIRPFFYDIRKHKHLKNINTPYKILDITNKGIMLPSYPSLKCNQQEYIINSLKEYFNL